MPSVENCVDCDSVGEVNVEDGVLEAVKAGV